jgi:hypothetical protein
MKILLGISAWIVFIAGIALFNVGDSRVITDEGNQHRHKSSINLLHLEQQEPTQSPAAVRENSDFDLTVAHNPGLVLGAVILVLIIIGGVIINSRLFKKK